MKQYRCYQGENYQIYFQDTLVRIINNQWMCPRPTRRPRGPLLAYDVSPCFVCTRGFLRTASISHGYGACIPSGMCIPAQARRETLRAATAVPVRISEREARLRIAGSLSRPAIQPRRSVTAPAAASKELGTQR